MLYFDLTYKNNAVIKLNVIDLHFNLSYYIKVKYSKNSYKKRGVLMIVQQKLKSNLM